MDLELAAEVVCAVARGILATERDAEKLKNVPLGNTVGRLLAMRGEAAAGESDQHKLIVLATALQRAKEGDLEAFWQLPDLVQKVREWFGLRH
ncbi:MAG TPA: hypothetical protein VH092_19785 [Urbifossiella sp.]|nr:hypothetical protein [Urbifossiella sp.]